MGLGQSQGFIPEEAYWSPPHPPCQICPIESSVYRCLLGRTWTLDKYDSFGSMWSELLVLHKYGVIISECQKVTFLEGQGKKIFVKTWKNQSCTILSVSQQINTAQNLSTLPQCFRKFLYFMTITLYHLIIYRVQTVQLYASITHS